MYLKRLDHFKIRQPMPLLVICVGKGLARIEVHNTR